MQALGSSIKVFNFDDSLTNYRIHDSLLSRLSNDDDLEKSLSTFASEMATSAMILGESSNWGLSTLLIPLPTQVLPLRDPLFWLMNSDAEHLLARV
jgi:hypothetical protein